jgi:uncharacterized protein YybS (DUF2232 family)
MTMKSAASLALIGAVLVAIVLVVGFVLDVLNVIRGLVPALRLVTSFLYAFASVGAVVFLWVFRNGQS